MLMLNLHDFKLQDIKEELLDTILAWRNSENIRKMMYNDKIIKYEEHLTWYKKIIDSNDTIVKILYYLDEPLGVINFYNIDSKNSRCYWGFYIGNSLAPKGSGTILGYLSLEYIFEKQNIRKLCTEVLDFNRPSLSFHKKLGFVEEGRFIKHVYKNNQYTDVVALAIFKEQWAEHKAQVIDSIGGLTNDN